MMQIRFNESFLNMSFRFTMAREMFAPQKGQTGCSPAR